MTPKASIILSVYNRLDFLKLVLAGFEIQTEKDFEIIISDDGSGSDFVAGVNEFIAKTQMRIVHNWHEDIGFRKTKLLNSSVIKSHSDYVIFVDGDCIPHPNFVEEHLKNKHQDVCLAGRRVDLSERITRMLTPQNIKEGILQSGSMIFSMFMDYVKGNLKHFKNGFYFRGELVRAWFNRKERGLLGANFSIHKSDLLDINGFDERYNMPTFGEDSDIEFRLRLNGVKIKPVLNMAVQYHCYHRLLPRPEESLKMYETAVKEKKAYTPYGIHKDGFK